jgi:hypothetical protein
MDAKKEVWMAKK